jgi:hypothetical protein
MTEAEFRALFDSVSNWGRWGERSGRGALNHLTPERVAAFVAVPLRIVGGTGSPLNPIAVF